MSAALPVGRYRQRPPLGARLPLPTLPVVTTFPTSSRPPRLLVLGDAVAPTGFFRVISEILSPLSREFEIFQMGVNYQGGDHAYPWLITSAEEAETPFGFNLLPSLLKAFRPELIFMLSDDGVLARWMEVVTAWQARTECRVVVYCPVDTQPLRPGIVSWLFQADRLFTFTHFGRRCLLHALALEQGPRRQPQTTAVEVMPHGIATSSFYPYQHRVQFRLEAEAVNEAKRKITKGSAALDDTFIVLNANRNQERKRLDITLRGFAQFAAGKPDRVKLYLHCGIKDQGWNVIDLARREGILDRLILSTTQGVKPAFPDQELNMIYNACDVGINTCSAEGWGLVSFEHAATGAAQVVPDHTGCGELWRGSAEMLAPAMSITHAEMLNEQYLVHPETVAASLERIYQQPGYYRKLCLLAYANATRADYQWANVSQKWGNVFRDELTGGPSRN